MVYFFKLTRQGRRVRRVQRRVRRVQRRRQVEVDDVRRRRRPVGPPAVAPAGWAIGWCPDGRLEPAPAGWRLDPSVGSSVAWSSGHAEIAYSDSERCLVLLLVLASYSSALVCLVHVHVAS